jgi:hypothetical protein
MDDLSALALTSVADRPAALRAAFARGAQHMTAEMASPENLTVAVAAVNLGLSAVELLKRCKAGQYYLLERETENIRFPAWQLSANESGLRAFIREFKLANRGCWAMHGFISRSSILLGGQSPKMYLQSPGFDETEFERALHFYLDPEQGAS